MGGSFIPGRGTGSWILLQGQGELHSGYIALAGLELVDLLEPLEQVGIVWGEPIALWPKAGHIVKAGKIRTYWMYVRDPTCAEHY